MKRENFRSRLGFLLVSAGCAIGIGNVWRFPYIAGQYGGGYFVLFYLICLLIMGVPVLTMELAVGRASRRSAVLGYKALEKPGQKWHIHGWFCLLGCYLLMMYYTTVSGWMVSYFFKFLTGTFSDGMATEAVSAVLDRLFRLQGLHKVTGECDARNKPSAALLERLGFTREGCLRQQTFIKGEWTDDLIYGLLATEWLADDSV